MRRRKNAATNERITKISNKVTRHHLKKIVIYSQTSGGGFFSIVFLAITKKLRDHTNKRKDKNERKSKKEKLPKEHKKSTKISPNRLKNRFDPTHENIKAHGHTSRKNSHLLPNIRGRLYRARIKVC